MPTPKFSKLHNALVVIIGGTSGIGFAVAEGSLESGARVVIASSSQSKLDSALSRLRASYPSAAASHLSGTTCDVSNSTTLEENLHALFKFAVSNNNNQKIDHIVNTAGNPGGLGALADTAATDVLPTGTLRYLTNMMLGKIAPGYMQSEVAGGSSLAFTGGTMALKPVKGRVTNIGWAGAVEALMRGLAVDLAPAVRVNMVAPGAIKTELLDSMANEQMVNAFKEDTLLKSVGRPEVRALFFFFFFFSLGF